MHIQTHRQTDRSKDRDRETNADTHSLLYFEVSAVYKQRKMLRDELTGSLYQLIIIVLLSLRQHTSIQLTDVLHVDALDVAG